MEETIPHYDGRGTFTNKDITVDDYLLEFLKLNNRPMSRPEVSKLTQIPLSTVRDGFIRLIKCKKVESFTEELEHKQRGRPRTLYKLVLESV